MMNKKQKILAIFTLGLVLFLLLSNFGQAQTQPAGAPDSNPVMSFFKGIIDWGGSIIGWTGAIAIGGILYFLGLFIGSIAAMAAMIGGWLVNFAVGLNYNVLGNPLIEIGWKISRDLANLGFVLFIIIIAIATILRMQQYGAKSALGKLIAVALLVNFSLVFAGIFIDFSNMLTNFFIKNIAGSELSGLSEALIKPFGVQSLLKVEGVDDVEAKMKAGSENAFTAGKLFENLSSLFVIAILTLIAAFCLLAFGVMFLIRYISLSLLLVLIPLACLFIILPATKNFWDQWWKNFMKWVIFAPAASFFLYLGVYLMNNYDKIIYGQAQSAQGIGTAALIPNPTAIEGLYGKIANLIITGGFMLGGLMVANSMGITGAKAFLGVAGAAGKWIQGGIRGFAGRKAWEGVGKMTGSATGRKWTRNLANSKFAPVKWVGQGINRLGAQAEKVPAEQYRKQVAGLSPQRLNIEAQSATGIRRAVILEELAKKKDLSAETISKYFSNGKTMGNIEDNFKTAGLNFGNITKTIGRTTGMLQAMAAKDDLALTKATDEFVKSLEPKDYAKGQWNEIFKETEDEQLHGLQQQLAGAFADRDPGAYSKIIPQIKGENLKYFADTMNWGINNLEKYPPKDRDGDEINRKVAQARESLNGKKGGKGGALGRRLMGEEGWVPPKEQETK